MAPPYIAQPLTTIRAILNNIIHNKDWVELVSSRLVSGYSRYMAFYVYVLCRANLQLVVDLSHIEVRNH